MKILQINSFGDLSTGRIATDLHKTILDYGFEGLFAYARNSVKDDIQCLKIGNKLNIYVDGILTRLTDRAGFFSKHATKKLLGEIDKYNPDIIHLHNLHGYYINIEMLFNYLSEKNKPVVWTLHDCWAFTGHCCYYSMFGCERWKTGCFDCPQRSAYPKSLFWDNSSKNYEDKKRLFSKVNKLYLVTVSKWLEREVKKSFLQNFPCKTIYNGIDTDVFKKTLSDFREKYGLVDKFIILGVASTWDKRKGFYDFLKLAELLTDQYRIVLVGIGKGERKLLKNNMIGIGRTNSIKDLVSIYSAADVFFNASVEETFGLPTIEAISCGTPAIVYDSTALPETVTKENGVVVAKNDIHGVWDTIRKINNKELLFRTNNILYKKNSCYKQYIELYKQLL